MKKALSIGGIALAFGLLIYFIGTGTWLMSSVLIGNVSFPDGTPKTREEALISTIDGFVFKNAKTVFTKWIDTYVVSYEATAWSVIARKPINVSIFPFYESVLKTAHAAQVSAFLSSAVKHPDVYSLVTFNGKNALITKQPLAPALRIVVLRWPTSIGMVTIDFKYNLGETSKDFPEINKNILKITQAYMEKYPPIDAKDYASFWGNATDLMGKIDLTKLPVISLAQ